MTNPSARRRAILCVVASSGCFTISAALVKSLAGDYPAVELMFFRSVVVSLVMLPLLLREGGWRALRPRRPGSHIARLAFGFTGMITSFYGYAHLPLATNTALGFCMPLFLTVLSVPLLGERVGWHRILAVLAGLAGVVIMVRPWREGAAALPLEPVAVVLFGVVTWALSMITIRRMGEQGESNVTIVLWFGLGSTVVAGLAAIPFWLPPSPIALATMLAVGLVTVVAQLLMTEGYRTGDTTLLAPFEYGAIIATTAMGIVIWNEYPDAWNILGIVVIIAAGLLVWHVETRARP